MCLTREKGKVERKETNKQKSLSDHGGARGGDAMKKETVSWQRKEKMTQNKHGEPRTKHHPLQFKPCKTEWWSGTSTTQPEPNPLLGRREQSQKNV